MDRRGDLDVERLIELQGVVTGHRDEDRVERLAGSEVDRSDFAT